MKKTRVGADNCPHISVRDIVEFILRYGSIDSRFTGGGSLARAQEGIRVHKKVQKSQGDKYNAEVKLKHEVVCEDFTLVVEGRADGIIIDEAEVIVDEIKTTTTPLEYIDEDYNKLHMAQAKCYAYMYAYDEKLDNIGVRLTYIKIENGNELINNPLYINKKYSIKELEEFFYELINKYIIWLKMSYDWIRNRNEYISDLEFPFDGYRKGQRNLAVAVYRTIQANNKLYAQAPTGIGKTISTLFPSIKAMGENHISKIFYLTAKTITRSVAQDTIDIMDRECEKLKRVVITAKEKICFKDKCICNPIHCEYANGHFDRINNALMDILKYENNYTRDIIEKYSLKHSVCPYELCLDITLFSDIIICDYNYVFNPNVSLKRFFNNKKGEYVFLIDEAHNLVDRSRDMFSASINKRSVMDMKKYMKDIDTKIYKTLSKMNSFFLAIKKQCNDYGHYISREYIMDVYYLVKNFIGEVDEYIAKNRDEDMDSLIELYFDCINFIKISELYDSRYISYVQHINDDVILKLYCLDPSYLLNEILKKGLSSVFFSATLLPLNYYKDILGGDDESKFIYIHSPFDREKLDVFIADDVSTKYSAREYSLDSIVEYIINTYRNKKGNYMVFFPSYKYMNDVYDIFIEKYSDIDTIIQKNTMSEYEREEFINRFKRENGIIGFCVLGGIYSEGIDLKYDALIGAIIVGVGLPKLCLERNIIRDYFNKKNGMGYEYSYIYPGMNKVLQAGGRVIRTEEDEGSILLIDERFMYRDYNRLLPKEWSHYKRIRK